MGIGGISTFQNEHISVRASLLSLVGREHQKTSILNQLLSRKESVDGNTPQDIDFGEARSSSADETVPVSSSKPDSFDPEFRRQRQAVIDNMEYRDIITSWSATSLNEVITLIKNLSLGKPAIDRAWMIFYWISQNIEYDLDSFFNRTIRHQTSADVFRNKKGVCDAFSTILQALCQGLQLECVKIGGYTKGYGYQSGKSILRRADHAWNAIRIDHRWYLVDSTWGAGYIDSTKQYQKRLNPHYFFTRPEQMIYDHFPEHSKWQLISPTISMQEFILLPHVHSIFFDLQLEIVAPRDTNIVPFDRDRDLAEVLIRAPADVRLTCSVAHDESSGLVQYDHSRKVWQCLFRPRSSGYQTLHIFARQGDLNGPYDSTILFGLNMPEMVEFHKFPLIYGLFADNKCQIFEPLVEALKPGTKVTIHCRIPGVRCVRLSYDDVLSPREFHLVNDIFKQEITVPNRDITVYGKFIVKQTSFSYDGLFKYTVE